jgi:hypothetical protein
MFLLSIPVISSLMVFFSCQDMGLATVDFPPLGLYKVPLMISATIPSWVGILLILFFPAVCDLQKALFPNCPLSTSASLFLCLCSECGAEPL